jgi:transcriptional regulator GlxA family with amidase domain
VQVAIPLYEGFTALDAIGPYEVLSRLPGAEVRFVGLQTGPVRTENGQAALHADAELEELPDPEVVCVPGGLGTRALLNEARLLGWIRQAHEQSEWTTSVCTGSLLLGAAGLLDGLEATTYWLEMDTLRTFGARPIDRRVVEEGKIITAAGVSAGLDMALTLVARMASDEVAKAVQLSIEYDPEPPFASGSPRSAHPETVDLVRSIATELAAARTAASTAR